MALHQLMIKFVNGMHRRTIMLINGVGSVTNRESRKRGHKPIVAISLHKSGTHLIRNILDHCGISKYQGGEKIFFCKYFTKNAS